LAVLQLLHPWPEILQFQWQFDPNIIKNTRSAPLHSRKGVEFKVINHKICSHFPGLLQIYCVLNKSKQLDTYIWFHLVGEKWSISRLSWIKFGLQTSFRKVLYSIISHNKVIIFTEKTV
jgi:hypothetical protein